MWANDWEIWVGCKSTNECLERCPNGFYFLYHAVAEFKYFHSTEVDITLSRRIRHFKLKSVLSVEHEDFGVENFSISKKESFFTGQMTLTRCSYIYVVLSLWNWLESKVNFFKTLWVSVRISISCWSQVRDINWNELTKRASVYTWLTIRTSVDRLFVLSTRLLNFLCHFL